MDILPDISKKKASKRESLGLKVLEKRDISINQRFLQIEKKINQMIVDIQELQCCNMEIYMKTKKLFRTLNDKNDSNTSFDDTTKIFCETKVKVYDIFPIKKES